MIVEAWNFNEFQFLKRKRSSVPLYHNIQDSLELSNKLNFVFVENLITTGSSRDDVARKSSAYHH